MTGKGTLAVLGAGAWGTALANMAALSHAKVWLWAHDPKHVEAMRETRRNDRRLPGFALAASRTLSPVLFATPASDTHGFPKDRVDVIDTTEGTVIVATTTSNAGIFTSSDIYLFPKGKSEGELLRNAKISDVARDHLRAALTLSRAAK